MSSVVCQSSAAPAPKRVAIVTGGCRGIGKGISERLASTGDYAGLLLTYNTDQKSALAVKNEYLQKYPALERIEIVGGDLSRETTRDDLFRTLDSAFLDDDTCCWALVTVVHNAGQYVGVTAENSEGIKAGQLQFGDGSLLQSDDQVGKKVNLDTMRYYQRLYGDAWVDICERSLERMRRSADGSGRFRGSLIGLSAPGCNLMMRPGGDYSMPGSGKSLMEYSMRIFALNAAPMGVNCNVIVPGITKSEAWERLVRHGNDSGGKQEGGEKKKSWKSGLEDYAQRVPMKEVIDPKDIGDAVVFLSSRTGGGRFVTGQALVVDGGFTMKR